MSGLLWGSQTLQIINSMIFIDEGNSLKAHITMGQGNSKFIKDCTDSEADMCGIIYKFNNK
jgi:hypothetical protein